MKLSTLRNEVRTYIAAAKAYDRTHKTADTKRSATALGKLRQLLSDLEEEVCDAELDDEEDDIDL